VLVLGAIGLPYFAVTAAIAARRHLWNDELFTYDFAHLPSLHAVWDQLATGVEQTPPLFYVLTRASLAAFGHNNIAIRLPAMVGVFVACCCVYFVVARRASATAGAAAALVVLATVALPYGYEARPYGVVLGLAGAALLCWQLRADTGSLAAVAALAFVLACGVSIHYYAALLVVPIAAADAARAVARRRVDVAVAVALAVGLAPLLAYRPLIHGARRFSHSFWTTYDWSSSWTFFAWLLRTPAVPPRIGTSVLVALVAIVVVAALVVLRSVTPEVAAAVAFLLLPLLAVALAKTVTGAFTERYTLSAVLGIAVLGGLALDRLGSWWRPLPLVVVVLLAAYCARAAVYDYRDVSGDLSRQRATIQFLDQTRSSLPIALVQPHDILELSHYAPPALRRRLVYLASPALARRYLGTDSTEDGVVVLSGFSDATMHRYRRFVQSGKRFLVFADPGNGRGWLTQALAADNVPLGVVARHAGATLYIAK
jgi:hypothetical protein